MEGEDRHELENMMNHYFHPTYGYNYQYSGPLQDHDKGLTILKPGRPMGRKKRRSYQLHWVAELGERLAWLKRKRDKISRWHVKLAQILGGI